MVDCASKAGFPACSPSRRPNVRKTCISRARCWRASPRAASRNSKMRSKPISGLTGPRSTAPLSSFRPGLARQHHPRTLLGRRRHHGGEQLGTAMVDYLQHAYGLGPDAAGRDHAFGITVLDFPAHVLSFGAGLAVVEKRCPDYHVSPWFDLGERLVRDVHSRPST